MVMLQVDQVDALFEEINVLRKNNWQEVSGNFFLITLTILKKIILKVIVITEFLHLI